jgi:hypothetical protein
MLLAGLALLLQLPHRGAQAADPVQAATDWANCVACHPAIVTALPALSVLRPPATGGALAAACNSCHRPADLARFQPEWTHPVRPVADHLHCSDCHPAVPHDARHPLPLPVGDYKAGACYACHKVVDVARHWPSRHGAETACRDCHPAHQPFRAQLPLALVPADAQARWRSSYDWYASNATCLHCHNETALLLPQDRGFVVLNTVNYHASHIQVGRTLCIECHDGHGSTRPALLRLRLLDGNVFSYMPRPNGGTCAVLCHGVDHRDWKYQNKVP